MEMNVWVPQSTEAIAEATKLLHVSRNIMSPAKNKINMGLVYDAITASFIMTREKAIDEGLYLELKDIVSNDEDLATLDERLRKHNIPPRSGRGTFSMVLPSTLNYFKGDLIILDGILISGVITGAHIGPSSKSIVEKIYMDYGAERYADFITNTSYMVLKYISERGHTVGIADCMSIDKEKRRREEEENEIAFEIIQSKIDALGPISGNDEASIQLYENQIKNIIMSSAKMGFELIKENISEINNNIGAMLADIGGGAKGKVFNIQQIRGRLGQQFKKGERLPLSCGRRIIPAYDEDDADIRARGYIKSNFMRGLTPEEHFMHMMAAREGLIDTAVNVAVMGDIHRRIVKALEDIFIGNTGGVINTSRANFQLLYGGDGFDPARLIQVKRAGSDGNPIPSFIDVYDTANDLNAQQGWISSKTYKLGSRDRYVITADYTWIVDDKVSELTDSNPIYDYFKGDPLFQDVVIVKDKGGDKLSFYYKISDAFQADSINEIEDKYQLESKFQLDSFKELVNEDIIINESYPKQVLRLNSVYDIV